MLKDLSGMSEENIRVYQVDCIARVKGGRSIKSLPDTLAHKIADNNKTESLMQDQLVAFDVDIINLLIGPLAEAKYIAHIDDELFNHKLVDLEALKNYGGSSDLELDPDYQAAKTLLCSLPVHAMLGATMSLKSAETFFSFPLVTTASSTAPTIRVAIKAIRLF